MARRSPGKPVVAKGQLSLQVGSPAACVRKDAVRGVSASSISLQWSPTRTLRDTASSPKCPMAACGSMRSVTVPDEFGLRFPGNGPAKAYKVIWRIGHDVGARLIVPVDSPAE